jgi:hypothetical protein
MRHQLTRRSIGAAARMVDSNMGHIGPRWIRPEAAVT